MKKDCPSQAQLLKEAMNKEIIKSGEGYLPDAVIIAEIKRWLSNGEITTFEGLAKQLYNYFSTEVSNQLSVNVDLIKYFTDYGAMGRWGHYDVNGIRISFYNYKNF